MAGVSTQVPVIVKISSLPAEAEPNSRTLSLTAKWFASIPSLQAQEISDEKLQKIAHLIRPNIQIRTSIPTCTLNRHIPASPLV